MNMTTGVKNGLHCMRLGSSTACFSEMVDCGHLNHDSALQALRAAFLRKPPTQVVQLYNTDCLIPSVALENQG